MATSHVCLPAVDPLGQSARLTLTPTGPCLMAYLIGGTR